jgi:hypothetical protein
MLVAKIEPLLPFQEKMTYGHIIIIINMNLFKNGIQETSKRGGHLPKN